MEKRKRVVETAEQLTPAERFWAHVEKTDTCWVWAGFKLKGYGRLSFLGQHVYAHRLAWELTNGPIPEGLCVLHQCDNPPCVRPDHLFLGTNAENMADRNAKGRHLSCGVRGENVVTHKLTEADVRTMRSLHTAGVKIPSLARRFNVHYNTAYYVVRNRTWRHIERPTQAREVQS